jgi:hypothetical protein
MIKPETGTTKTPEPSRFGPTPPELSEEDKSKDAFFLQLAEIAEAMIAKHGKEFAMGTLVLSARFIAENRPLIKKEGSMSESKMPPHAHHSNCSC